MFKSSCIFPAVFFAVIISAVSYYIITNYGHRLFNQDKINNVLSSFDGINESLELLKPNQYKDSLMIMITDYREKIENLDINLNLEETIIFLDSLSKKSTDGVLDSLDFKSLKKVINNYER